MQPIAIAMSFFFDPFEAMPQVAADEPGACRFGLILKRKEHCFMRMQVTLAELEIERQRAGLISRQDAERAWQIVVSNANAKLGPLGERLAPRLVGKENLTEVVQIIDDEVWRTLNDLADYKPSA